MTREFPNDRGPLDDAATEILLANMRRGRAERQAAYDAQDAEMRCALCFSTVPAGRAEGVPCVSCGGTERATLAAIVERRHAEMFPRGCPSSCEACERRLQPKRRS